MTGGSQIDAAVGAPRYDPDFWLPSRTTGEDALNVLSQSVRAGPTGVEEHPNSGPLLTWPAFGEDTFCKLAFRQWWR